MPLLGTIGESSARAYGLYGGRKVIALTISSNTNNYDVYTNRGPDYAPGLSDITVTINPGVTVGSTTVPAYAMLVPSAFSPTDTVTIVNNGLIQGMGGTGGAGGFGQIAPLGLSQVGFPGGGGGSALYANRPVVVTNNGTIAAGGGGGGGGGGTGARFPKTNGVAGGGGGGGGAGTSGGGNGAGGPANPGPSSTLRPGAAGSSGTSPAGGAGGSGGADPTFAGGNGGTGGGRGAAGSAGGTGFVPGPSVPSGSNARPGGSGGAAGNYIVGNPFVTWPVTGTRQGNVA